MRAEALEEDFGKEAHARARAIAIAGWAIVALGACYLLASFYAAGVFSVAKWEIYARWPVWRFLLGGLGEALKAAVTIFVISAVISVAGALGQLAKNPVIRMAAVAYSEIFRSIPTVLLVLFAYFGAPSFGIQTSPFWALVIGSSLYNSAVLANILRAGISSIPAGQWEAARAIGLSQLHTNAHVIWPQALRRVMPAMTSQAIVLLKDSSLGFVVGYDELMTRSQQIGSFAHNFFQAYIVAALVYLVLCLTLAQMGAHLERRSEARGKSGDMEAMPLEQIA